jgi:hypothetical protein
MQTLLVIPLSEWLGQPFRAIASPFLFDQPGLIALDFLSTSIAMLQRVD